MAFLFCGFAALPSVAQTVRSASAENLDGKPVDPFRPSTGKLVVLLFVRTDCPISNRYAPTIRKLHEEFRGKADFWLVYPDAGESAGRIRTHGEQFHFVIPALRDVHRNLVKRSHATITPEAAVFDSAGKLVYHGRIDDWYEDFGRSRAAPTTQELDNAIRNTLEGKATVPDHANAVGCYISDMK
jgi:hypothetical protein